MVKVTASRNEEKGGCNVNCSFDGNGQDIANEVVCIIEALMSNLNREDIMLHAIVIQTIAENPYILTGESKEEYEMRTVKTVKGIN